LEYCIQAWGPHLVKDIDIIDKEQRRAIRMIEEYRGKSYNKRLDMLVLTILETEDIGLICWRFSRY